MCWTGLIGRRRDTASPVVQLWDLESNIHRTSEVQLSIAETKVSAIPTVPYSPQLNEPVECFFGIMKGKMASQIWTFQSETESPLTTLKKKWADIYKNNITPALTESLYANWLERLNLAMQCVPMTSQHVHRSTHPGVHMSKLRGYYTYREYNPNQPLLSPELTTQLAVSISEQLSDMEPWTHWHALSKCIITSV